MENQQYNTNEVYSSNFKTGNRTYFVNMLEAKNSAKYVKITESRKVGENEYQKNRIMLFQNDLIKLSRVLNHAVMKIKGKDENTQVDDQQESLLPNEELDQTETVVQQENNEFPNSGKKWTDEDEEKLEFLFKAGKTVEDLIEIFGRKKKGIEIRLTKLGLIESK